MRVLEPDTAKGIHDTSTVVARGVGFCKMQSFWDSSADCLNRVSFLICSRLEFPLVP